MTVEGQRYLEECRKVLKEEQMDAVSMGLDFGLPVSDIQKVVKSNQEAPVMKAIIIGLMEGIGEIDFLCEGNYNQFQVREIVEGLKNGLDLEEVLAFKEDLAVILISSLFILLVAAGLAAGAIRAFHEAGLWNHFQDVAFDLSNVLSTHSLTGTLLEGIFGYQETPSVSEVAMYFIYLVPALVLFAMPPRTGTQASRVTP